MENIAIIGVGLLGGSLIQALKKYAPNHYCFSGYARCQNNNLMPDLNYFVSESQLPDLMQWADGIILCTPVGSFAEILQKIKPYWQKKHWLCDVGSTKKDVAEAILNHVPKEFQHQCIPTHPIAGSHESGWQHARADLFVNKQLIVTSIINTENTDNTAHTKVINFWRKTQSQIMVMTPEEHDDIFALTSHLPHLLAYSMMSITDEKKLAFVGTGFKDFTRIAQSDATMWADILLANQKDILNHLAQYQNILENAKNLILNQNKPQLMKWIEAQSKKRETLI